MEIVAREPSLEGWAAKRSSCEAWPFLAGGVTDGLAGGLAGGEFKGSVHACIELIQSISRRSWGSILSIRIKALAKRFLRFDAQPWAWPWIATAIKSFCDVTSLVLGNVDFGPERGRFSKGRPLKKPRQCQAKASGKTLDHSAWTASKRSSFPARVCGEILKANERGRPFESIVLFPFQPLAMFSRSLREVNF